MRARDHNDLERLIFFALKRRHEVCGDGLRARELEALEDINRAYLASRQHRPLDAALKRLKAEGLVRFVNARVGWQYVPGTNL